MSWCDNEREHERDGREAFRRYHWREYEEARRDRYEDDCKAAFVRGYERAEYEAREERRLEEEREEREARHRREQEEVEQWPEQEWPG